MPPANAVSLDEALSLQTEVMEHTLHQTNETPAVTYTLPTSNKAISALNLERDAPRIKNDTALFYVEQAPVQEPPQPQPKQPIISPWTKQRLDQKPVVSSSTNYSNRIGMNMEPDEPAKPASVWSQPEKETIQNYSNSIGMGIVLPFEQQEKKSWKPMAVPEAVPLEEILKEEKLQKQQQKEEESLLKGTGKKGKKGKKDWKPVDLSFKSTPTTNKNAPVVSLASGRKSFKEIQEEQMKEKKQETAQKQQTTSRGR